VLKLYANMHQWLQPYWIFAIGLFLHEIDMWMHLPLMVGVH